jgi:hypothetical protein
MWEEFLPTLKYYPRTFLEGLRKATEIIGQNFRSNGWNSNRTLSEYISEATTTSVVKMFPCRRELVCGMKEAYRSMTWPLFEFIFRFDEYLT